MLELRLHKCFQSRNLPLQDLDFQGDSHFRPFPVVTLDVKGDFSNEDNSKLHLTLFKRITILVGVVFKSLRL